MSALERKLIARAKQACVGYYHQCTVFDDWGTMPEHWSLIEKESPAKGYMNRFFTRDKPGGLLDTRGNRAGCICVTFLNGEISDVGWFMKPSGVHAHPEEDYQHNLDAKREKELANKPAGYGDWA